MTEQEKQVIRDERDFNMLDVSWLNINLIRLLDALDERDRKIKWMKKHSADLEHRALELLEENQQFRKALQEINWTVYQHEDGVDPLSKVYEIACQAISGEEDDELKYAVAAMILEDEEESE